MFVGMLRTHITLSALGIGLGHRRVFVQTGTTVGAAPPIGALGANDGERFPEWDDGGGKDREWRLGTHGFERGGMVFI